MCAVSTNISATSQFGIDSENVFGFWDWVGGRYSLFSAVGISIVLAYGKEIFEQLQSGASNIDNYLSHKNFLKNPSWIHACINLWNLNFLNFKSLAIIPYSSMLQKFPAFLQQMWMESNGRKPKLCMDHWLPIQVVEDNCTTLSVSDVLCTRLPKAQLSEYYSNQILEVNSVLNAKDDAQRMSDEELIETILAIEDSNGATFH